MLELIQLQNSSWLTHKKTPSKYELYFNLNQIKSWSKNRVNAYKIKSKTNCA